MVLEWIGGVFTVCQVADGAAVPWDDDFVFAAKTDNEWSLVCRAARVPEHVTAREDGWRAFRVQGALDFSLVGVLHALTAALSGAGIALFAISTYDTDYILIKEADEARTRACLAQAGYEHRSLPHS